MEAPTNKKKLFIVILTIVFTWLISYTVYSNFIAKEGFDLFGGIAAIFEGIIKLVVFATHVDDFLCWLGDAVKWTVATIAALMYYASNIFSGCILFYFFDIVVGTVWYLCFIFASIFGMGDDFTDGSQQLSEWRNEIDDYFFGMTGMHAFRYSDQTIEKCYQLTFEPFPEWPF